MYRYKFTAKNMQKAKISHCLIFTGAYGVITKECKIIDNCIVEAVRLYGLCYILKCPFKFLARILG